MSVVREGCQVGGNIVVPKACRIIKVGAAALWVCVPGIEVVGPAQDLSNCPGSWTDGKLAAHFIQSIKHRIGRYKIVVDQGFPHQREKHMEFWLGQFQRRVPIIYTGM